MKLRVAAIAIIPFAAVLVLGTNLHAQPPTKSVWDGVYSQAQADRGKGLYSEQCASCHGSELTGGEMAPPLSGGEIMAGSEGVTVGDRVGRDRGSPARN